MEQVFQALIDRSRVRLDLRTIKTILGCKRRPKYRSRKKRAAEWEVAVERPVYDLTILKLHCGGLTLKIYTKGERVLRIEVIVHNARELDCGRALENFPKIICQLKAVLERFADALSCIDPCFIADHTLERLPTASRVGKVTVGGIDLNKPRMRALGRRSSHCLVHRFRRLHRFRARSSRPHARQADPGTIWSHPRGLRPEEAPRPADRPAHR